LTNFYAVIHANVFGANMQRINIKFYLIIPALIGINNNKHHAIT